MSTTELKNPEKVTSIEKSVVIKNFCFDGRKALVADKVLTVWEITRKIDSKTGKATISNRRELETSTEKIRFNLIEITVEQLRKVRKTSIPSFVLKENGKYYYTRIHRNISFVASNLLGKHLCAGYQNVCNRLSAASDQNNGCAAIRDNFCCIERFPFIRVGYETFNTRVDSLVVIECNHFYLFPTKPRRSIEEINAEKLKLAQYVWPDVKTLAEVRLRKHSSSYTHPITTPKNDDTKTNQITWPDFTDFYKK